MLFLNPPPNTTKAMSQITTQTGSAVFIGDASDTEHSNNPCEIPSTQPSAPIIRHPEFFFDNTLVAIQIENTLFNIHKYQLTKSDVFSEIFKMPKPEGDEPEEGASPEHPIVIQGAAASDFAALLKVLYASHFSSNQPTPEAPLIIPAFRLANLLGFSELRTYLLPLAEKNLDDVEKIVFAREFGINEWLAPALIRLCKRATVLSAEEARKLEVDSVLLIWRMREQHRSRTSGITPASNSVYCQNCTGWKYHSYGTGTCQHCLVQATGHYTTYVGPGKMAGNINTNDTALEADDWAPIDLVAILDSIRSVATQSTFDPFNHIEPMLEKKPATLRSQAGSMVYTGRASDDKANVESSRENVPQTIIHHPEFFFDNTLIAVQIDNTMFNVHKYQLVKSEVFSDMFQLPKPEGDEPEEGSSPKNPIVIEGVSASDFAALLRVLYASHFSSNQPAPEAPLIIPAFRLANMFNFSELRAFLLPLAEKSLGDVDKIVFAREFNIKEWLAPAFVRLCQREERLTVEEARKLEVDSVLMISHMREQFRERSRPSPNHDK
ncbi:unnamed protein product [Rhizoctonia solani]|uniref:BTB domain-containing protein n=1 Tax=Rhizoctonia solani TaxID=456999 RepID=A0A8H3E2K0_9AGAM|nr:unnamed protein product [Rhizoctonia solani]